MPQASDELRAEWDGPSEVKATQFLVDCGYALTGDWTWKHKDSAHKPTIKEISAVTFMMDEWDYGWFEK